MKVRYIGKLIINMDVNEDYPGTLTNPDEIRAALESRFPEMAKTLLENELDFDGAVKSHVKVIGERIAIGDLSVD